LTPSGKPRLKSVAQAEKDWRYPWGLKPKEKQRMTIAAGFLCSDGVVLCSDSLYSGRTARQGSKLWHGIRTDAPGCGFAICGAGKGPLIWAAKEMMWSSNSGDDLRYRSIAHALEGKLVEFYDRHHRTLSEEPLELLFAVRGIDGVGLYLSENNSVLGPVDNFACIGSNGSIIAAWLAEYMYFHAGVKVGQAVASYILRVTREYDPEAGRDPRILTVSRADRGLRTFAAMDKDVISKVGELVHAIAQMQSLGVQSLTQTEEKFLDVMKDYAVQSIACRRALLKLLDPATAEEPQALYDAAYEGDRDFDADEGRLIWKTPVRDLADAVLRLLAALPPTPTPGKPCSLFSPSTATDECKHCGWTEESHEADSS
jgi:hypothetical protein